MWFIGLPTSYDTRDDILNYKASDPKMNLVISSLTIQLRLEDRSEQEQKRKKTNVCSNISRMISRESQ